MIRLVISVVVAMLATGGAAAALWHIGRNLRQYKSHDRHLDVGAMGVGAKMSVVGAVVLTLLIAAGAFYRVFSDGVFSGLEEFALLLAVLVAVVMFISSALLCATAFRDGSPQVDDLRYFTRTVAPHLTRKLELQQKAGGFERELARLREQVDAPTSDRLYLEVMAPDLGLNQTSALHVAAPETDMQTAISSGSSRTPLEQPSD